MAILVAVADDVGHVWDFVGDRAEVYTCDFAYIDALTNVPATINDTIHHVRTKQKTSPTSVYILINNFITIK